jgi:hypothetical protein
VRADHVVRGELSSPISRATDATTSCAISCQLRSGQPSSHSVPNAISALQIAKIAAPSSAHAAMTRSELRALGR